MPPKDLGSIVHPNIINYKYYSQHCALKVSHLALVVESIDTCHYILTSMHVFANKQINNKKQTNKKKIQSLYKHLGASANFLKSRSK